MFVKILHWLGIVDGVLLADTNDNVYRTWKRQHPVYGHYWAYVYPFTKLGRVILGPNGSVDSRSESKYIVNWIDM